MIRNFLIIAVSVLLFASCSSSKQMAQTTFHDKVDPEIDLRFSNYNNVSFKAKQCVAMWDKNDNTICISGLLIRHGQGTAEELSICIEGVDLNKLSFPYKLNAANCEYANVSWFNEAEVLKEKFLCEEVGTCEYQGDIKKDKIEMVLTHYGNNVLEGKFSGRIFLKGTGDVRFVKTSEYKDISSGYFRIPINSQTLIDKELAERR